MKLSIGWKIRCLIAWTSTVLAALIILGFGLVYVVNIPGTENLVNKVPVYIALCMSLTPAFAVRLLGSILSWTNILFLFWPRFSDYQEKAARS
jgi:hypothetical protein